MRDLDRDAQATLAALRGAFDPAADPATACALLVGHLAVRRNKRCLLAYHRVRADKIEEKVWAGIEVGEMGADGGAGRSSRQQGQQGGEGRVGAEAQGGGSSLSAEEEEYARQFGDLIAAYKGQWTDVDLTGSLDPPRDLFIDVRVLKDAGEIQTEYG